MACASIVHDIYMLANEAKVKGVPALVDEAMKSNNLYLRRGLFLIVDDVDPELVKKTLHASNVYSLKTGVELLKDIIALEGVLMIQAGLHPKMIVEILMSYLGDDVHDDATE